MAIGPVMWLKPDSHPIIDYDLPTADKKLKIYLQSNAYQEDYNWDETLEYKQATLKRTSSYKGSKKYWSGRRSRANMSGFEICIYVADTIKNHFWCSWVTRGEKENLEKPSIDINMYYYTDNIADKDKALAYWQQIITSLKRRGK